MNRPALSTVAQRRLEGRGARALTSRLTLGHVAPRPDGYDPVERLLSQSRHRVPSLNGLRFARMLESPLAFFRGAALVMAEDLARGSSVPIEVQSSGDAHLSNFGIFASPERRLVFDLNDFDETEVAPFEWDVKRLTSSLVLAAAALRLSSADQETIARLAAKEYRTAMQRFAEETRLDVWYSSLNVSSLMHDLRGSFSDSARRHITDALHEMRAQDARRAYERLVTGGDAPRIALDPPHFTAIEGVDETGLNADDLLAVVANYGSTLVTDRQLLLSQFTPVDVARHVVGVGSVGTECFVALLCGRDHRDAFFLQIKEAHPSVIAQARARASSHQPAERVVHGQRVMQVTPDAFLGWHTLHVNDDPRSFYVRQLYDHRASIDLDGLSDTLLTAYGRLCAWTLARAHARSGHSAVIAGYLGKSSRFDESMGTFALSYKERNDADYAALRDAVSNGRITVPS